MLIKPIWKCAKFINKYIKGCVKKLNSNYAFRKRVKHNNIDGMDYGKLKNKVEKGIANNWEREAYFTHREKYPYLKLPPLDFENVEKDFIDRHKIKNVPPDILKYMK